jgi:diguanylate cyclase (GGDEF)-like protein/PAS domain S-box-containing protein
MGSDGKLLFFGHRDFALHLLREDMTDMREERVDNLDRQIGRMRSQLSSIEHDRRAGGARTESTEDLRMAIEELYVAEEELRLQHEELLGVRAELEDQRRGYEELFQLAPDAYLVTNPLGIVREANRAAAELLGIESRFLIGKPLATYVDADDRADLRALVNAFGSAAQVDDWSVRLVRRSGAPITVSLSASAARDARNELLGIRWIVRDMSARDRSERALLALADKRRGILDTAPQGIFRLDRDGSVDYANPAAARLLGRSEAELRGRQLIDVFVEGQSEEQVEGDSRVRLERAFGGMRPGSGQWEYTEPAGQRRVSLNYMLASLVEADSVVGSVVSLVDITDRSELERDLRRRADRDALTGLYNRSAFERELERELGLASRYRTPCAMLVLDVDSLKVVNDVHGHLAGDAVLRAVAMALRKRLRQTDVAGRLGGDEFGVLLPQADETAARTVGSEILTATRAHEIAPGPGGPAASVSVGIALVKIPGLRTTDVFRSADEAMYRGKNTGGDRIVVVDAALR